MSEMTFGEKAVGLLFNPSGATAVDKIKAAFAEVIDKLYDELSEIDDRESLRYNIYSRAIGEAIEAQMWAVKAITFPKD